MYPGARTRRLHKPAAPRIIRGYSFLPKLFKVILQAIYMGEEGETIYERVAKLEDQCAELRDEVNVLKRALRNKIARHEIKMIKHGTDVDSIID
ncbi:hypothetical protein CENSYa_0187 [Cenarchaeum symbiosum A]|uniref:Uncharacterized protein n=1 Tax=Cenarchaeum symbiosum (strain A) TaxID=414004 RepID=A0RU14_CENSY|nr:hypothetical protein CENSYa_0187 [Cenarchaeum symbiosum A]